MIDKEKTYKEFWAFNMDHTGKGFLTPNQRHQIYFVETGNTRCYCADAETANICFDSFKDVYYCVICGWIGYPEPPVYCECLVHPGIKKLASARKYCSKCDRDIKPNECWFEKILRWFNRES